MRKLSIVIAVAALAASWPLGEARAGGKPTVYPAQAVVADLGQSVQSDGLGVYVDDGDTSVYFLDSRQAQSSDKFLLSADASGESTRVIHLSISALAVDTDCAAGSFHMHTATPGNWFNAGGGTGSATLSCDGGSQAPSYFVTWNGCVAITSTADGRFNFKPSCAASVRQSQGGPPVSVDLPVPFDITAGVA